MELKKLNRRISIEGNKKLGQAYYQFEAVLNALRKREVPNEIIAIINSDIDRINSFLESEKELKKQLKKTQAKTLKLIENELNLVTKNYYHNLWLLIGIAAFGVPIGTLFDNMGLIGVGMPIGMAIGALMDRKAFKEGRQLDIEL